MSHGREVLEPMLLSFETVLGRFVEVTQLLANNATQNREKMDSMLSFKNNLFGGRILSLSIHSSGNTREINTFEFL